MKVEQLQIRNASQNDLSAAYDLIQNIYASTDMMSEPFSEKYPSVDSFERELIEYTKAPGAVFLLAELPQGLTGYVAVIPQTAAKLSHTAYLNMGVSENARGKSVGRSLLEAAVSRIQTDGIIEILYLNVRADNLSAIRLYESTKFETIAVLNRDTKFDGKYYDGLLMRRFIDVCQSA